MTGGNSTREAGTFSTLSSWRKAGRRRWTSGRGGPSVSFTGKMSSLCFNTKFSIQPSCPSGSVSDPVRSPESQSLLTMRMRVRLTLLVVPVLRRKRKKKRRRRRMNKHKYMVFLYMIRVSKSLKYKLISDTQLTGQFNGNQTPTLCCSLFIVLILV